MRRIPELDSLRGLAAVGVVLFHAFPHIFYAGWASVDLFFVLSGFLITTIILHEGRRPGFVKVFYFRRAIRIWPVYYLTLAAVLFLNAFTITGYQTAGLPYHLVFLQNLQSYWFGAVPGFPRAFMPSWSVAVEEQFYMIWPLLVLGLGGRKAVPPLTLSLILISLAARRYGLDVVLLVTRFDGLALGGLLAYLLAEPDAYRARRRSLDALFLGVGVASTAFVMTYLVTFWRDPHHHWKPTLFLGFGLFFFSVLGLMIVHSGERWLAPLRWKPLRDLGLLSYSMYMTHMPIMIYTRAILGRVGVTNEVAVNAAMWILILVVPILSYLVVERPILSLRRVVDYKAHAANAPLPDLSAAATLGRGALS